MGLPPGGCKKAYLCLKRICMYKRKTTEDLDCGITVSMKIFGAKWKPCLIDAISRGISRPSDLHRSLAPATPRVLDMQLSELERHGVVVKEIQAGFPLRTDYRLTPLGRSILPIIARLDIWGKQNKDSLKNSRNRIRSDEGSDTPLSQAS
jgi:DNA-binding HxlR family transcriptional regulator